MKNINDLKKGQNVVFSFLPQTFTVEEIDTETGNIRIFIEGSGFDMKTNIENIFQINEHTTKVSISVFHTVEDVKKRMRPLGVKINDKLMETFLKHWITMCEAEGDEKALEIANADLELFITALNDRIKILKNLNIDGIQFIAPIHPDDED